MGKVSSIITLDEWLQFELLSEYWLLTNPVGLWGRGVEVASGGGKAGWLGWCTTTVASVVLLMLLATPALSLRLLLFLSRSRGSTVTAALLPREHNGIEWRTLPIVWSGGARPRVMYTQKTVLLGRPVYSAVDVFRPETRDRLSRDAEGGLLWCLYTMVMVPRPIVLLGLLPILTCLLLCCMPYCGAGEVKTATKLPWCSVLCRVVCIYHKRQWCGTVVLIMEEAFVLPSKVLFEFGSTYLFLK